MCLEKYSFNFYERSSEVLALNFSSIENKILGNRPVGNPFNLVNGAFRRKSKNIIREKQQDSLILIATFPFFD